MMNMMKFVSETADIDMRNGESAYQWFAMVGDRRAWLQD